MVLILGLCPKVLAPLCVNGFMVLVMVSGSVRSTKGAGGGVGVSGLGFGGNGITNQIIATPQSVRQFSTSQQRC